MTPMSTPENDSFQCGKCGNAVQADDDFCPHCGGIFGDAFQCVNHQDRTADGACIICALPLCPDCGGMVMGRFLCNHHSSYEIYEGMVRIYGGLDDVAAQYAKTCLEQAGLHPLLYCRRQPLGGPRFVYTLYSAAGDYDGHVVNEIKVMVPTYEVAEGEKVLASLELKQPPDETA
jgi:hypothetical protein